MRPRFLEGRLEAEDSVLRNTEASALFAYSSLVELGDGRIGMIYEASPTTSWSDGLRYMYYEEFTMSELTAN